MRGAIVAMMVSLGLIGQPSILSAEATNPIRCVAYSYSRALVRSVQKTLQTWGYDPGPADGIWGSRTQSAVVMFQQHLNLDSSGELDESTLRAMFGKPVPPGVRRIENPDRVPETAFQRACG